MSLVNTFQQTCIKLGLVNKKLFVAYSGGMDSTVLLYLCKLSCTPLNIELEAIHIDHRINPKSQTWATFCKKQCQTLDIELHTHQLNIADGKTENLENQCRQARYKAFGQYLKNSDCFIALAHHQQDQFETIVKRMMTGSGPKGLQGMPQRRALNQGHIVRPLLCLSKEDMSSFANQHNLQWVEDPSNDDLSFERNFIRKELIPKISEFWPNYPGHLLTFRSKQNHHHQLSKEIAEQDYKQTQTSTDTLNIETMRPLSHCRQLNLLDLWLSKNGFTQTSLKTLKAAQKQLLNAEIDKNPSLKLTGLVSIKRYQHFAYLVGHNDITGRIPLEKILPWTNPKLPLQISEHHYICQTPNGRLRPPNQDDVVTVRYRQANQSLHLANKKHRQTVKNLMQQWHIPPWLRDSIPFVFYNNECVCVVGYCICAGFEAQDQQSGISFKCFTKQELSTNQTSDDGIMSL